LGEARFAIEFGDRKVSVTASGDLAQAQVFDFFLPRGESKMPVLSIFHTFDNNLKPQELLPFLNGHVYLLRGASSFDPSQPGMAFDLKWSSEDRDRTMVKAFLGQLCLQTAAELVAIGATSASWAFSYPTAFSTEQIEGFPEIWNQVTTDCVARTGLSRATQNAKQTESVAAAQYFVHHLNAATQEGTIFIDIGGSTSDISVWQERRPVWQTSVLLAGRNIFSDYLWHNPEFLNSFNVDTAQLIDQKAKSKTDRRPYYALTDALLGDNHRVIFESLPINAGSQKVKALRQHLALGVSGLFYYVGSLLQYLTEIGIYRNNVPNVYVGGNGSKIFRWLDIDGEGHINALYKTVFSQGAGWTDDQAFKVILSPEPKMEAAYGLVCDPNLPSVNVERKVLAGESFITDQTIEKGSGTAGKGEKDGGSRELPWNTTLTAESFTKRLAPPKKLERLNDFISAFNQFARNQGLVATVDFTNEEAQEVGRGLGQSMSRYYKAKTTTNIVVEPIFVIALRQWLEIRLGG
jgi:hypothetical protein